MNGRPQHRGDRTHLVASAANLTRGALVLFLLALLGWLPTAGGALPDDRREETGLLKYTDFGSDREFLA